VLRPATLRIRLATAPPLPASIPRRCGLYIGGEGGRIAARSR
jgi:hypothetical protein